MCGIWGPRSLLLEGRRTGDGCDVLPIGQDKRESYTMDKG
jgi:hypothetical protein